MPMTIERGDQKANPHSGPTDECGRSRLVRGATSNQGLNQLIPRKKKQEGGGGGREREGRQGGRLKEGGPNPGGIIAWAKSWRQNRLPGEELDKLLAANGKIASQACSACSRKGRLHARVHGHTYCTCWQ